MGQDDGRPRGILTQADREYLAGERDLSVQAARNTRRRIRNRVKHALGDFEILWAFLSEEDLELIFGGRDSDDHRAIRSAVQDMIAFGIIGLCENDDHYPPRIKYAIQQAAFARNRRVTVELEINEQVMDSPNDILRKIIDTGFKHTTYEEFEKAYAHPDTDPELLVQCFNELDPEGDITIDEVRQIQSEYENSELVRPLLPKVINVQQKFSDTRDE